MRLFSDPFILCDWLNKRIHDRCVSLRAVHVTPDVHRSHGDTTPRPIYFPDEFNFTEDELQHVMQQVARHHGTIGAMRLV